MAKQEIVVKTLKDVFFYYTTLSTPKLTYNAKQEGAKIDPENPNKNTEYTVQVATNADTFKKLKKAFKGAINFKNAEELTVAEFNAKFHSDGKNVPDFGDIEEVVVIKFASKAQTQAGKDLFPPKVVGIKGRVQDSNGNTVAQDTLIANGSFGHIQFRPTVITAGLYLYPSAICLVDLIEYIPEATGGIDDSGFGIEELDEADMAEDQSDDGFDGDDDMF